MPKTIHSQGISPNLCALGNAELEHIQHKQMHAIKQAQVAETFRDDTQQKAKEMDLLCLCKTGEHTWPSEMDVKWKSIARIVTTLPLPKGYQGNNDGVEVLSSKLSPQQHTALHLLITHRTSLRWAIKTQTSFQTGF